MLLTVAQAAQRVGRNPETVRRWIRQGILRSQRVGSRHLIEEADLLQVAGEVPLRLPSAWERSDDGSPMPPWEQLVRDGRSSH